MQRPPRLAAVAVVALGLSGCVSVSSTEQPRTVNQVNRSVSPDGYSALLSREASGGPAMSAGLDGELVLSSGNCFQVLDDTGEAWAVMFPKETTIVGGPVPGLDLAGRKFSVGDKIRLGGGSIPLGAEGREAAGGCAGERELFVVHTLET